MKYACTVTINTAALLPKIGEFMNSLNETMRSFGVDQKVQARSEIGTFSINSEKELTLEQLAEVRIKAEAIAQESQPAFDFRFGPLREVHE